MMMLHKFTQISLLLLFECPNVMSVNTYTCNSTYWRSDSDFIPFKDNTPYGNISLHRALRMEYDFIYYGKTTSNEWEQVFRIGYGGDQKCNEQGTRFPSMYINHYAN